MSGAVPAPSHVHLHQEAGLRFRVQFDGTDVPNLLTDEAPPAGEGKGPSPSDLLAAAVGNCLGASFLFCLTKARVGISGLDADVEVGYTRNAAGRLRIAEIRVHLILQSVPEAPERARRCAELFEDFCLVTNAVRNGVPVVVNIEGLS